METENSSLTVNAFKIFLIFFLVGLNGFFVAAEFAIVKVRNTRIQSLATAGSRRARMALDIISHLDAYLSATQLGITIASILLGAVGEEAMRHIVVGPLLAMFNIENELVQRTTSFLLGTGVIVFLHVVLGELAPKSLAIQRAEGTTLWVAYPMRWFYLGMYPLIAVLNGTANALLRLVGIQPASEHEAAHTEDELRLILHHSGTTGAVTPDKLTLMESVFDFSRILVRQIMVPRPEVAVFDLRRSLGENLAVAERTAHSRYPLVDKDLDHVHGVIHMKDLFWQLKDMEAGPESAAEAALRRNPMIAGGDLASHPPSSGAKFLLAIAREVLFVPETMRIDSLLREFQQKRIHMAIVVDEYGGTSGLVTFENVIEEIVGEVQDEFDQEAPRIRVVSEREFILDGSTPVVEVNEILKTRLSTDVADTIGGYVLSRLGRFPKPGDQLTTDGLEFTIREMRRQRIYRLAARLPDPEEQTETTPPPVEQENEPEEER